MMATSPRYLKCPLDDTPGGVAPGDRSVTSVRGRFEGVGWLSATVPGRPRCGCVIAGEAPGVLNTYPRRGSLIAPRSGAGGTVRRPPQVQDEPGSRSTAGPTGR